MAAINAANVLFVDSESASPTSFLRLVGVNSGDTIDVSTVGSFLYHKLFACAAFGHSQRAGFVPTVVGTVLTLTSSGMSTDTVDLLIIPKDRDRRLINITYE